MASNTISIADGHCDYLYHAVFSGYTLDKAKRSQALTVSRLQSGGVGLQLFAVWVDLRLKIPPLEQALKMISRYHAELAAHPDELYAYTPAAFAHEREASSNRVGCMLTMENSGEACGGDPDLIDIFARLGVRTSGLIWNDNNKFGQPAKSATHRRTGLTKLGREAVRRFNANGIAIDLAHLNDKGIDDVLTLSDTPPFASHSNARGAYDCRRSLCDEHIREIARRGGVIGVNFYYGQLTDNKTTCLDDILNQMDYIAAVGGIDCVAIGSDFDGMDFAVPEMAHPEHFPNLIAGLERRGYSADNIAAVMGGNLRRYLDGFFS